MVYAACHPLGPREVDEMENWEIASYLGGGRGEKLEPDPDTNAPPGPRPSNLPPGVDLVAERMRAAAEGRKLGPESLRNP